MPYAVLIDGGFVIRKLGTKAKPAQARQVQELVESICAHEALRSDRLHRAYFYYASPLTAEGEKPLRGGKFAFGSQPIVARSQKLLDELKRAPYFSLRLGELAFRGWEISQQTLSLTDSEVTIRADDLKPSVEQKGVDMRIGMDIAALTLKRHVGVIVLVTGDSDFIPAMKFARREGAQVLLAPLGHSIKEGMEEHSDLVLDLPLPKAR